ncbi:MAG TPA: YcgN family cysteine cluster protein [Anaerolineaceae bacterium]|nr:YcgN family cysteine cluster protein [Anaerolineaceae bacterium]
MDQIAKKPFWKTKTLGEMTPEEWESLCDGCARCCLIKFQDEETGKVYQTNVACKLLDIYHCRCTSYPERARRVPTCLVLNEDLAKQLDWMPETCAYRRLANGQDLEWWHPLVSGSPKTVHQARISVRNRVVSERDIDPEDLEDYIIDSDGDA